jgi:N-methylhydantoinase B
MADTITTQIVADSFEAIATEMSGMVERTAVHPLFQEVHDYSTGVFHAAGGDVSLVARSARSALPNHIFASIAAVQAIVDRFGRDMEPGDVFLVNDPYHGGNHLADWALATPVALGEDELVLPSVRAHMSDFGGVVPGGYNPAAREIWQEGYRLPPIRLVSRGARNDDVWRLLLANSRLAETLDGDLLALVGGCTLGARRVTDLVERFGAAAVSASIRYSLDYSAARMAAEVAAWPDGTWSGERLLDHDSAGNRDVLVRASATVEGERLTVDFAGSAEQSPGYVNSVYANTVSWVLVALGVVLPADLPMNSGVLRHLEVHAPPGTVVNARPPAPTMFSSTVIGSEIGDAVLKALEDVTPERVGSAGLGYCLCTTSGRDARYADALYFTIEYGNTLAAAGGAYGTDGWGALPTPHCALVMANVETQELQFPFLYERYEYLDDSCAPGRWRGLPAFVMRRAGVGEHPSYVNLTVEGNRHTLPGFAGGWPGAPSYAVLSPAAGEDELVVESVANRPMDPGAVLLTVKGAGGGWGPPFERDPDRVVEDVLDDLVSPETARSAYGVALAESPDGVAVDAGETARLRAGRPPEPRPPRGAAP